MHRSSAPADWLPALCDTPAPPRPVVPAAPGSVPDNPTHERLPDSTPWPDESVLLPGWSSSRCRKSFLADIALRDRWARVGKLCPITFCLRSTRLSWQESDRATPGRLDHSH